ncbi:MAG TPA: PQQ-binding-like beta-propeller repeat protein [Pyrinomonadaceae bacterium]|nr:PQQ-binding-like beta-propeller repeat protein [Pyrinomonadaceae bacterium]
MFTRTLKSLSVVLLVVSMSPAVSLGGEWPQWRGPKRDGAAATFRQPKQWPEKLKLKWRVNVGFGAASPVMSGQRVYLFTNQGQGEVVTALGLGDGRQLWQDKYAVTYERQEMEKDLSKGPKSTPVLHDGSLYTVGVSGIISAYDAATGKLRWRKEPKGGMKEAYPVFGMAISPLVANGLLIAPVGGNRQSKLTAFDTKSGEVRWQWGAENLHPELGLGFSSPILAEVAGTRQIVFWTGRDLVGLAPETGKALWTFPFRSQWDSVVTPVFHDGMVIVSGNPMGTVAVRINKQGGGFNAQQVWQQEEVFTYMNTPVATKNLLFGLSVKKKGQFFCLDLASGKTLWLTDGREAENASFLSAGESILILTNDANLTVVKNSGNAFESIRRYQVADSATWAHPIVFDDQILVKDEATLALWSL